MYSWNKKKTTKFSIDEACAIVYHYLENVLERIEQHLEFDGILFEECENWLADNIVDDLNINQAYEYALINMAENSCEPDSATDNYTQEFVDLIVSLFSNHNDFIQIMNDKSENDTWYETDHIYLINTFINLLVLLIYLDSLYSYEIDQIEEKMDDDCEEGFLAGYIIINKLFKKYNIYRVISKIKILSKKTNLELEEDEVDYHEAINSLVETFEKIQEIVADNSTINARRNKTDNSIGNTKSKKIDISIDKLKQLDKIFSKEIIGQPYAVKKIHELLVSNLYNLDTSNRPYGCFFFVGPTGVGKTEIAKVLSKFIYNSEKLCRFDMSEYKTETAITKLIGADNGFVGYEEGGTLINAIKKNPDSIILFDEIEKANPLVFDLFLQILDEGFVTANTGEKYGFKNNIIIFTSNIGASQIRKTMSYDDIKKIIKFEINEYFTNKINRPEILGRIGKENIVAFNMISKIDDQYKILDILFEKWIKSFSSIKLKILFDREDVYKNIIADVDPTKGARDIRNEFEEFKKHFNMSLFEKNIHIKDLRNKQLLFDYDNIKVSIIKIK